MIAYSLDRPCLSALPDELTGRVEVLSLSLDPVLLQSTLGLLEVLQSLLLNSWEGLHGSCQLVRGEGQRGEMAVRQSDWLPPTSDDWAETYLVGDQVR